MQEGGMDPKTATHSILVELGSQIQSMLEWWPGE